MGIVFQDKHRDGLYVSSLVKGGPAYMSHMVKQGDILTEIDGADVSNYSVGNLVRALDAEQAPRYTLRRPPTKKALYAISWLVFRNFSFSCGFPPGWAVS